MMDEVPFVLRFLRVAVNLVPCQSARRRLWHFCKDFVYGFKARRRGSVSRGVDFVGATKVNRKTVIGEFSVICGLRIAGDGVVEIGRNCHIAPEVLILTQNHDYDDGVRIPYGDRFHEKPVRIADFVWIGQRVTILPGATIGEGAIVQAGSVVHGKIPPMSIVGGNPARAFAKRNEAHFLGLKANGSYDK